MIAISNLGPLLPLELPTNMNFLLTSMTTHIPRITPPQAPPMVALTCQLRNSFRFTLATLIGLLMSPPLPLGSLPLPLLLADPTPEDLLAPSFFLPTSTNSSVLWPSRSSKSTMPPPDPPLHPIGLSAVNTHDTDPHPVKPPTDTPTGDPAPPQIPLPTLIWTTLKPVKPSPLMTPPLSTSCIPIPPLTLSI